MKRVIFLLVLVLIFSLSVISVSAENDPDGFVFDIQEVDTTIGGEDSVIFTSADAVANGNLKWAVSIHCEKVEDNLYRAKADAYSPTGEFPVFEFEDGDIVIGIHSSSSNPAFVDEYPNVVQKATALNVTEGMYFLLVGIDLDSGAVSDGKAICGIEQPIPPEESQPDESEPDESEPDESTVSEEESSSDESKTETDENSDKQESNISEMATEEDKIDTVTLLLIIAAGIAAIVVIGVIIAKKRKK